MPLSIAHVDEDAVISNCHYLNEILEYRREHVCGDVRSSSQMVELPLFGINFS